MMPIFSTPFLPPSKPPKPAPRLTPTDRQIVTLYSMAACTIGISTHCTRILDLFLQNPYGTMQPALQAMLEQCKCITHYMSHSRKDMLREVQNRLLAIAPPSLIDETQPWDLFDGSIHTYLPTSLGPFWTKQDEKLKEAISFTARWAFIVSGNRQLLDMLKANSDGHLYYRPLNAGYRTILIEWSQLTSSQANPCLAGRIDQMIQEVTVDTGSP